MSAQIATKIEEIASSALEMFNSLPSKDLDFAYTYLKRHFISKVYEVLEEAYVSPGTNVKLQCIRDLLQTYQKVIDDIAIDRYDRGPVQTKLSIGRTAKFTAKRLVQLLEYNEIQQRKAEVEMKVISHDNGDSDSTTEICLNLRTTMLRASSNHQGTCI